MKKIILLSAIALVTACSGESEAPAPAETTAAAATAAAATEPGVAAGTYDVEVPSGKMGSTVINADGSYVDTASDGTETRGAYARKDGKDCFDPAGDEPELCWTFTEPGPDGSFTATAPDGTEVTVTPRSAAEPIAGE